jgi:hypothetical protein
MKFCGTCESRASWKSYIARVDSEERAPGPLPFPESLCHRCAAPPKYVRTATSTFILCPLLPRKYPPQPVRQCPLFTPRKEG